jgi:hypothetical protein
MSNPNRDKLSWVPQSVAVSMLIVLNGPPARVHLIAGYEVVVPQLLANPGFRSELAAAAADSGAQFVEVMVAAEGTSHCKRYSDRRRAGHDPVHDAAAAADLEGIGRTYDRLVAFAATREPAISLPSGTSDAIYQALQRVLRDRVR